MPQIEKADEIKIRDIIKKINSYAGTKLSYKDLYNKIDGILKSDSTEREDRFTAFYIDLSQKIGKNLLSMSAVFQSNPVLRRKYQNHKATDFSITTATTDAKTLASMFCNAMEPENPEKYEVTPKQIDAIRDWELEELKKHSFLNEIPQYLSRWDRECYKQDLENLEDSLDGYTFRGDPKIALDITASEFYLKKLHVSAELASHGAVWRFFNFRKVAMYEKYVQEVDKKLAAIGFKPENHNDMAFEFLRNTTMPPHSMDVDTVKMIHSKELMKYKARHVEQINLARNRIAQAQILDTEPETSFEKKLEPILKKYDLAKINVGKNITALEENAKIYDRSRNIDNYSSMMRMAFFLSMNDMMVQAMKSGKDVNMAEIVKDARTVCVTFAAHYTPLLEVEEYDELETPVYLKGLDEKLITNRIKFANGNAGVNLEQEKIDAMKQDALSVINEWHSDPAKIKKEDKESAKALNSTEPSVIQEDDKVKSESMVKEQLIIDLDADTEKKETYSAPVEPNEIHSPETQWKLDK